MENNSIKNVLDQKLSSVNANTRKLLSETFKDKVFTPLYDISLRDQKELAYDRLKKVMSVKPCSVKDFLTDPNNIFTMHEMVRKIKKYFKIQNLKINKIFSKLKFIYFEISSDTSMVL